MPPAGGGLIILPKKSWNVWNRDNVERVRRDEAAHAEKLRVQAEKQAVVDAELRLKKLKKRSRKAKERKIRDAIVKKYGSSSSDTESDADSGEDVATLSANTEAGNTQLQAESGALSATSQHVNFFEAEETEANAAEEARLRRLAEFTKKHETMKKLGIAPMKLAQSSAELSDSNARPWYHSVVPATSQSPGDGGSQRAAQSQPYVKGRNGQVLQGSKLRRWRIRSDARKDHDDPINKFQKDRDNDDNGADGAQFTDVPLQTASKAVEFTERSAAVVLKLLRHNKTAKRDNKKRDKRSSHSRKKQRSKKEKSKKKRSKKKKKRKSRHRRSDSDSSSSSSDTSTSGRGKSSIASNRKRKHGDTGPTRMQLLRAQRLQREENERQRAVHRLASRVGARMQLSVVCRHPHLSSCDSCCRRCEELRRRQRKRAMQCTARNTTLRPQLQRGKRKRADMGAPIENDREDQTADVAGRKKLSFEHLRRTDERISNENKI